MKKRCISALGMLVALFLLNFMVNASAWGSEIKDSESAAHGVDASKYYVVDTYAFPGFKLIQMGLSRPSRY